MASIAAVRIGREIYHRHDAEHRTEIADALGSVGFYYGAVRADSSGSRLIYLRNSDTGLAIFGKDAAAAKTQTFCEWPDVNFTDWHDQVSPFSPDNALFAHCYNTSGEGPEGYIAICSTDTGKPVGRVDAPEYPYDFVWLSDEKLAWTGSPGWNRAGSRFHIHVAEKQADGQWTGRALPSELTNVQSLAAVSSNTVAVADNNGLELLDIESGNVTRSFKPTSAQITAIDYSQPKKQFLVALKLKGNYALYSLAWGTNGPGDFKWLTTDHSVQGARFVNAGKGYAYFNEDTLIVKSAESNDTQSIPAIINTLITTRNGILFNGALSNEPWAGVWSYDVANRTLANVIPYSDIPSTRVTRVDPLLCTDRDGDETVNYYVYYPAHFDRQKKYPLVIGDTPFGSHINQYSARGPSWAEALANAGAYVVIVDRKEWFRGIEKWEHGVMAIYDKLIPDPTIDSSRIYLYGASAETREMHGLIEQKPELWKGVLLLNPTDLPDLLSIKPSKRLPRILISAGTQEEEMERLKTFQRDAFGKGIIVTVQEVPNSGHFLVCKPAILNRTRAMVNFVFDN